MNITDPSPDDITLQQATALAGCCAKTIRRAVQDGQLPRRYVMSERGPQLVFARADMDRWITDWKDRKWRRRQGRYMRQETQEALWSVLAHRIADLQSIAIVCLESRLATIEAQRPRPFEMADREPAAIFPG